jgi:hypothetical protein
VVLTAKEFVAIKKILIMPNVKIKQVLPPATDEMVKQFCL